jgi:hypothetical protein
MSSFPLGPALTATELYLLILIACTRGLRIKEPRNCSENIFFAAKSKECDDMHDLSIAFDQDL